MENISKNRVGFFDIDGTIRNKSLTESLFEILVRDYKYRGKDFNKYFELQSEISSLRKAYKSSEDRADDLFGEYCQKVVKFAMFALKNYTIEEVREIGRRVAVEYRDHQDYVFSKELIKFLRQEGFELVAISGSPKFLVDAFVKEYGFSKGIGQDYVKDEKTGIFKETSIRTFQDKHIFIEELLRDHSPGDFNRDNFYIVAVGDTECDFSMMEYTDKAFIINPSIRFFSKIVEFFKIGKLKQYSDFGKYTIVTERKRRTIIQYIRTFPIKSDEYHVDTWSPLILKDSDIAKTLKDSV